MTSTLIHVYTNNEKFQLKITINEFLFCWNYILSWNYKPDLDSNRPNLKKRKCDKSLKNKYRFLNTKY